MLSLCMPAAEPGRPDPDHLQHVARTEARDRARLAGHPPALRLPLRGDVRPLALLGRGPPGELGPGRHCHSTMTFAVIR
jgi:hypothetical protein